MATMNEEIDGCQGRCRVGRKRGIEKMNVMHHVQPRDTSLDGAGSTAAGGAMGDVSSMISDAMSKISIEERDVIYQDLHCVPTEAAESPEMIETALLAMDVELQRLLLQQRQQSSKTVSCEGLQLAMEQNPDYTSDPHFRLAFLRADELHASKAALRFLRHFNFKLKWFGKHTLCREITWGDLTTAEQTLLKQGFGQFLPFRDQAGRIVTFSISLDRQRFRKDLMYRALFYHLSIPEPDRRQPLSIVFVMAIFRDDYTDVHLDTSPSFPNTFAALPLLIVAGHICVRSSEKPQLKLTFQIALMTMTAKDRARAKFHEGTVTENVYALMTFGIPYQWIPLTLDGKPKLKICQDYLEMRRCGEQARATGRDVFLFPRRTDVLMGKGKPIAAHHGNQILKELVTERSPAYNAAGPGQPKDDVVNEVFDRITHQWKGRFLSKEELGVWEEITLEDARQKIIQSFHVHNRKSRVR